jgi:hypothetical protein
VQRIYTVIIVFVFSELPHFAGKSNGSVCYQTLHQTKTNSLALHNTSFPLNQQKEEGERSSAEPATQHPRQFVTGAWVATL